MTLGKINELKRNFTYFTLQNMLDDYWKEQEHKCTNFIPDKCFLLFQAHELAHVQPQTQCTITSAAKEERSEVKEKGEKGSFEL